MVQPADTQPRPLQRKGFSDHDRIVLSEQDHDRSDQKFAEMTQAQANTNRLLAGILASVLLLFLAVIMDLVIRLNSSEGLPEAVVVAIAWLWG